MKLNHSSYFIISGLSIIFNPAPMTPSVIDEFPLNKVDILQVNETEATTMYQAITGKVDEPVPEDLVKLIMETYPEMQGIVMTLGGDGVLACFRHKGQCQEFKIPVAKANVKDTTAAGDTFVVRVFFFFTFIL
jgi:ribokinase